MQIKHIPPQKKNTYFMPTDIYFGRDSSKFLNYAMSSKHNKKFLLICGNHLKKSPIYKNIITSLRSNNITIYKPALKESNFLTINQVTRYCRSHKFEGIIAIGGGKVLDIGKVVSVLATHDGNIQDYLFLKTKRLYKKGLIFIALPTTAGTGSEVTPWATIWGEDKKKYSLSSKEFMFPNVAIIDPGLTDDLSKIVTAESGIDALCQSIEAYWNINNNPVSDKYALKSIKYIIENLESAVKEPTEKNRDNMAWGSLLGGLAFSNTQTTICHAVSYPITAHWDIPHGQATSITLPSFLDLFLPFLSSIRRKKLLHVLSVEDNKKASNKMKILIEKIGLKTKLSSLGLHKKDISLIVSESFYTNRNDNSPVSISPDQLKKILISIY